MTVLVTTPGRTTQEHIIQAKELASELNCPYVERKKRSILRLQQDYQSDILIARKERLELFSLGSNEPFFFHPNSAAFRLKRLMHGEEDPMIEAAGLMEGDSFLDTTAGLSSDSIIAAYAVGEPGIVHACEKNTLIAYLVGRGLKEYISENEKLNECMRKVKIFPGDSVSFLKQTKDNSYDVVYMDPMFEEVISEANNFQSLRQVGAQDSLTAEWVQEAIRVARKRVVLKAHFRSPLFQCYGFTQEIRLTSKFHYGVIDL